ncbi:unnamed protein product, partial [Mesorhabditis spiculigera]
MAWALAVATALLCASAVHADDERPLRVAVVGEGVIGTSTAFAIKSLDPEADITVYHDKDFNDILSKGIAGLFRIDDGTPINMIYGRDTFDRLAYLWRTVGGHSGVQMLSGHILSQDRSKLDSQWHNYGDIVYNYHNLTRREMQSQFNIESLDTYEGIHYTAYTSEGARYVPWMKKQLLEVYDVKYIKEFISDLEELASRGYDVVVNCGGLAGGKLAGDGDEVNMFPIRGMLLKTKATWQKHFLYRDFLTFTIPVIDAVYVGTVKAEHNDSLVLDQATVNLIWKSYLELQPAFMEEEVIDTFVGLRPARVGGVRVERDDRISKTGANFTVVHNYGHSGNGFTLGWGSAMHAAKLVLNRDVSEYIKAKSQSKVSNSVEDLLEK